MKKIFLLSVLPILVIIGTFFSVRAMQTNNSIADIMQFVKPASTTNMQQIIQFPVEQYVERRTQRGFGEYIKDRFTGYHVADDVEFTDKQNDEVPVFAIADGIVADFEYVPGYGGFIRIVHDIDQKKISAIYGHIDLASTEISVGSLVERGTFLANLGDHQSTETDGERKHLHFALYSGENRRILGYVENLDDLYTWINPTDFFAIYGLETLPAARTFLAESEFGGNVYESLSFSIPKGHEIEYIPQIEALNVYTLAGEGSARERSVILIRYFDASDFLTLSTVQIYNAKDIYIGKNNYLAREYDIEKQDFVSNFPYQPEWRNERHVVTDVRKTDRFTRYYVIAKNPSLTLSNYNDFLTSIDIK